MVAEDVGAIHAAEGMRPRRGEQHIGLVPGEAAPAHILTHFDTAPFVDRQVSHSAASSIESSARASADCNTGLPISRS